MCPVERNTPEPATSVVRRMAMLLDAFGPRDTYVGVNELARRTGLPRSTVSRLATEMQANGFLERHDGQLGLSLKMFEWGERASRRRSMREVALPYMADLREATHQTIHLAILEGTEVLYVEILRSHNAPRLPSRVGGRLPAHATGVGKALLAAAPADVVDRVIATGLPPVGPRTIHTADLLRQQLKRVVASGIAYEHEESGPGAVCVASVIRNHGAPVAAISASGWAGKVDIRRVGPAVHTAALTISRALSTRYP
ncbi:IclR family transcriptional regulator [Mycolicibacterium canariasense]|nr:IclR family transcriptional regulator [Mycolicibacterium canariasense]